jgi:hypothetical protein
MEEARVRVDLLVVFAGSIFKLSLLKIVWTSLLDYVKKIV